MVEKLDGRVIVRKEVGDFLYGKQNESAKDKITLLSAVHAAERLEENPLVLEDSDYDAILEAVNTNKYVVDTGNYYINIGKPVNRDEFLSISGVNYDSGERSYDWDFEGFANAKLFTLEEIKNIVPEPYRSPEYLIMENIAKELYEA